MVVTKQKQTSETFYWLSLSSSLSKDIIVTQSPLACTSS